jgi:CHAT domain-containing protein
LEKQKEKLEVRLSRLSRDYALRQEMTRAGSRKIAQALPSNTVLLEFAKVDRLNFTAKEGERRWLPPHYLVFVLHSGKDKKIKLVDLGDSEKIDRAVFQLKKEISNTKDRQAFQILQSSRHLSTVVFDPLIEAIGDIKEIYISPDGILNLIPFEVLQGPDGRFLIQGYTFCYLTAGRDILGFGKIGGNGEKALLLGDPDFDSGLEEKADDQKTLNAASGWPENHFKRSLDMRGLHFTRLPGTREEVKAIQALLGEEKAELYAGKEAVEEVLRFSKPPRVLHLATHGFFLSDTDLQHLSGQWKGRGIKSIPFGQKESARRIAIENPLIRSGIALAGANHALASQDKEKSDGIVTAEKILGLRLEGTDMVVLSACDTGLGEVKTGEGVFGMRRAFTQAGTKSLVMSMWSVPDKETKELMIEFYKNIKSGKMNRCQALRQAALREMEIVEERYGNTNPLFWGAFVFMGEP